MLSEWLGIEIPNSERFDFKDGLVEFFTETTTVNSSKIMQRKLKRQLLSVYLPREKVRHEAEISQCPCCGDELHSNGEDVSEKLIFIPAKVSVERHIRPKSINFRLRLPRCKLI